MMYWILFIAIAIASVIVSKNVENKFKKFSKIPLTSGMTGREVAEKMLYDNDIHNVTIQECKGRLTDHYNPTNRTLNLSPDVYHGTSVAAAAVAAHECGHAVQHATDYAWLSMRSMMVPAVSFSNAVTPFVLLVGMILINRFPQLMLAGIALFALTTLFSFITLPVEVNASKRALLWLNTQGITSSETHPYAEKALRSAAYTYVVAALSSLATLLYYVMIYMDRR